MVLFYRSLAACGASWVDQTCLCLVSLFKVFTQAGVVPAIFYFCFCGLYPNDLYLGVVHHSVRGTGWKTCNFFFAVKYASCASSL